MRPLLADPALEPSPADIRAARDRAAELLRIRFSSPLFRLGSAREIQRRVGFPTGGPDQTPGVIVMAIERDDIVVVFNATPTATTQTIPRAPGATSCTRCRPGAATRSSGVDVPRERLVHRPGPDDRGLRAALVDPSASSVGFGFRRFLGAVEFAA